MLRSQYKQQQDDVAERIEEGQIMVRVEQSTGKRRSHIPDAIDIDRYEQIAAQFGNRRSFHEIIACSTIRFVMDIDGLQYSDEIDVIIK